MKFMCKSIVSSIFILITLSCVSDNGSASTYEIELEQLNVLKSNIETLASTSICNESVECKFIAFGSKPCGGPWGYLIYSTSIDTVQLETWVEDYNQKQAAFNVKWGLISDCSVPSPPTSINCENNTCIPIY